MASSPDIPEAVTPAVKPEREIDVAPEDIQLGTDESSDASTTGKSKLKRPRSATGTGLSL